MTKAKKQEAMTIDDQQNLVIDEKFYDAAIIPETKREMWRRISLRNETIVGGSIMCGNLEIHNGPCTIGQSVLAREEIAIELGSGSGRSCINGCVQSARNFVVDVNDDKEGTYLAVLGDVHSRNINLTNSVIYGNIYGERVIIRESVVLGSVYSRKRLEVSDSVIGQYLARSVNIGPNTHLLHPVSASENHPDFEGQLDVLLLPDNEEDPVVIPLAVDDLVTNTLDFDDPDAILPNYVIGLGMRMLNADEVEARVRKSAEAIAKVLINTASQEEEVEDRSRWEKQMLSYTDSDFNSLDSATFSLREVSLPSSFDGSLDLLTHTTPLKKQEDHQEESAPDFSDSDEDIQSSFESDGSDSDNDPSAEAALSNEQLDLSNEDDHGDRGSLEDADDAVSSTTEGSKLELEEAKIRFAKGEISKEELHEILKGEND